MGDFDRNENSGKKNESKKLIMVGVLGVLLLALVWFQFMKKSPEAMASSVGGVGANSGATQNDSDLTPEQALAELSHDPTAGLLKPKTVAAAPASATPPRNPFQMSQTWRASFTRPVGPVHNQVVPIHPSNPIAAPQSLAAENFKLSGIVRQGDKLYAIINNKVLTIGNIVGKARILEIRDDGVLLQHVDSPDGPILQLSSEPTVPN